MLRTNRRTSRAAALAAGLTLAAGTTLAGAGAAVAAPSKGTGKPLSTALDPEQEVGAFAGVQGASGFAALRLNPGRQQICVDASIEGFDPALAHIHEGARGTNDGVVVNFTDLIDGNTVVGCVDVDRALVKEIIQDPADYYVNVHLGATPEAGFFEGVRGQLG